MYIIKIMFEFIHSPLWFCNEDGIEYYHKKEIYKKFYDDKELNETADKLEKIYMSFFYLDRGDSACFFDEEAEKANKDLILELLNKLNERLNDLNDGKFQIIDYETEKIKKL